MGRREFIAFASDRVSPRLVGTKPKGTNTYYTENSILPENMAPLIITAAPYGPAWLPGDASDIALSDPTAVLLNCTCVLSTLSADRTPRGSCQYFYESSRLSLHHS